MSRDPMPVKGDLFPGVPAPDGFYCFAVHNAQTNEERHGVVQVRNFIARVVWTGTTHEAALQALYRATGYWMMLERMKAYRASPACTEADEREALALADAPIDDATFGERVAAFLQKRGIMQPSDLPLVDQLEQDGKLAGMPSASRPQ